MPFRICFLDDATENIINYEIVMQVAFGIDVIVTFFTAYYNEYNILITSKSAIASNYLKGWFSLDFISWYKSIIKLLKIQ